MVDKTTGNLLSYRSISLYTCTLSCLEVREESCLVLTRSIEETLCLLGLKSPGDNAITLTFFHGIFGLLSDPGFT